MRSYLIGDFRPVRVKYAGVTEGLMPNEKEVELHLGGSTIYVLVDGMYVDSPSGTMTVLMTEHPDETGSVLVDVMGESTSGTRRIAVARDALDRITVP